MPVTVVGAVEVNPFVRCAFVGCGRLYRPGTGHGHHFEGQQYPTDDELSKAGGVMVKSSKKADDDPKHSDRESVTARLRKIRDIVQGREAGPLTEIRDNVVAMAGTIATLEPLAQIVVGLDARLAAMITKLDESMTKLDALDLRTMGFGVKLDAIFAAVAPQDEKATSFAIDAQAVPAAAQAPPPDNTK